MLEAEKRFREGKENIYDKLKRLTTGYGNPIEIQSDKGIKVVEYSVPFDLIYSTKKDGTYWSRWCVYAGDDIYQNENASYNSCHKFVFRPYRAIFSTANLSDEEQNNVFTLLINFVLSALVSNLPLLILLFITMLKIRFNKLSL